MCCAVQPQSTLFRAPIHSLLLPFDIYIPRNKDVMGWVTDNGLGGSGIVRQANNGQEAFEKAGMKSNEIDYTR